MSLTGGFVSVSARLPLVIGRSKFLQLESNETVCFINRKPTDEQMRKQINN